MMWGQEMHVGMSADVSSRSVVPVDLTLVLRHPQPVTPTARCCLRSVQGWWTGPDGKMLLLSNRNVRYDFFANIKPRSVLQRTLIVERTDAAV